MMLTRTHPNLSRQWAAILLIIIGVVSLAVVASAATPASTLVTRLELDRRLLAADTEQTALLKITLDAPSPPDRHQRPPVNLGLVMDRSGSMAGRKLTNAKLAAIEALARLDRRDIFSVVVYDHQVQTIVPARSAGEADWIRSRINAIVSGGNTALFGGVSQGAAEVRKSLGDDRIHRILLLSDGIANVGPRSPQDLGRLGAALIKEGISVSTVGVGTDYNEDLMAQLAENSDGNTYFVETSADLPRIFAAELGDVLNVVARRVRITIECPDGVQPLRIIGREGRIRGRTVELGLNQLYGNQEKYALVQVQVAPGASGSIRPVAQANVVYLDPFTKRTVTSKARVSARYSGDPRKVAGSVNRQVARDANLSFRALAQEKAIQQADEGDANAAAATLEESAADLDAAGDRLGDEKLKKEAKRIRSQAETVRKKGMTPVQRKVLRTDSYKTKRQQSAE